MNLETLITEMDLIILPEEGIHITHPLKEAIFSIVRDAWKAAEDAEIPIPNPGVWKKLVNMDEIGELMDAEQRTHKAIHLTRTVLFDALCNPLALIAMYANDVDPEDLQDKVYDILEYLEKTKPEEVEKG